VNVLSTLTNTTVWFVAALCLIVDVWMYGHFTGFIYLLRTLPNNVWAIFCLQCSDAVGWAAGRAFGL